jgi:signal transduction histidine kinase
MGQIHQELGRLPEPGRPAFRRDGFRELRAFVVFNDGRGGLVIGPIDPVVPNGSRPFILILALLLIQGVAFLVVWRIAKQLRRIEEASKALGAGDLAARVSNPAGPSSELAESFNDMAGRIETLVRDRDELLQAVSHELGSPLARMRLQLELAAGSASPEQADRIEAIAYQVDELDQLVEDLLRWVQSDQDALRIESFDAAGPLAHLAELAQLEGLDDKSVEVEVDTPDTVTLRADPRNYQRAVDNLLRNAVRYASSRVRLTLARDGENLIVSVEDDGPGIPAEDRSRVVEPFVRVDPDRDRRTGGAGLGLAIVTRIMRAHGGELLIEQSDLGGARVALRFPLEAAAPA